MAKASESKSGSAKKLGPRNIQGYQGNPFPAGEIRPPRGPAGDVPAKPSK